MPTIVHYNLDYPSLTKPFENSANATADGLVTGTASFVVPSESPNAFRVNSPVSQLLFSSLAQANLSGLFVESRSIEKRNGMWILRVNVIGATNPPVVERRVEVSPRSLSKTAQITVNDATIDLSLSLDYLAETTFASTVIATGQSFEFEAKEPQIVFEWNRRGVTSFGLAGTDNGELAAQLNVLRSETREEKAGIVRITKTAQAIYE
jgi:hypothetical protein